MHLGIVRDAYYLSPVRDQLRALAAAGCARVHEESGSDFVADRRIRRVIFQLRAGDTIVVQDIGVLCSPRSRPAHMLRDLLEAGLELHVTPSPGHVIRLTPDPAVLAAVQILAEQEREPAGAKRKSAHQGGSRNPLSKYQIEYARKLFAEGESLRAIGLLFQLPPSRVVDLVATGHETPAAGSPTEVNDSGARRDEA